MMKQFEKNICNTFGKKGERWLQELPKIIKSLKEHWSLSNLVPVTNMSFHYVAKGISSGSTPIILKIGFDHELTKREALVLQVCNGKGYARLFKYSQQFNALLLEQIHPGTSLKDASMPLEEIMNIYGQLEQAIDIPFSNSSKFPTVANWLTALDEVTYPKQYSSLHARSLKIRKKLLLDSTQDTLLHGDLHLENILYNGEKWVCIDPKGVIGDRGFEIAAFDVFSDKEMPTATSDEFQNRLRKLSEKTAYPYTKLIDWFFLRLNLSAAWGIEDSLDPTPALKLASLL